MGKLGIFNTSALTVDNHTFAQPDKDQIFSKKK